ncbi:hypothetical protein F909_02555 [Acinetobacter sp. ANC 3929]|uniref:DUF6334 family protein n=1 Tax=unclassified Acinetobacter TaxID=196816 RepID=UPI0002CED95C|nr:MULTISPECIES: DUF6334 family protein [unclassified Acinetobacter]ENW81264.1 hypothetical protein F909_02555 [Acinetobacter sp. ANC 3929]MCH7352348.1 DUF6334 family protein [Acinetobacter sp. NIPH 2023]MCH7356534.1 DUF6334 family protein [Acinetobacter sp. NIPH 1958]MCH7358315.1 DUF6334 family protein [Acinetobacter sp. NIPH 2024]
MIRSNIFESIKDERGVRRIDNIYLYKDENITENSFSIEQLMIEIDYKFWVFQVNREFDEIELILKTQLEINFDEYEEFNSLSNLKGLEIGTLFAIINDRGYTDGVKLKLFSGKLTDENHSFHATLTLIALASGLQYELSSTGIDTYLI